MRIGAVSGAAPDALVLTDHAGVQSMDQQREPSGQSLLSPGQGIRHDVVLPFSVPDDEIVALDH